MKLVFYGPVFSYSLIDFLRVCDAADVVAVFTFFFCAKLVITFTVYLYDGFYPFPFDSPLNGIKPPSSDGRGFSPC